MGVGYSVGPLSKTYAFLDVSELPPATEDPPAYFPPGGKMGILPRPLEKMLHFPSREQIMIWQNSLSQEYGSLIGEMLYWNEDSSVSDSEDVTSHGSVLFEYVAAMLDEHGEAIAADMLLGQEDIVSEILRLGHQALKRPDFHTRFPQLFWGASFWLPYRRNVTFEAPDWRGDMRRYGSVFALSAEIDAVRAFIRDADPPATAWNRERDCPPTVFAKAWQTSETFARLALIGCAQHLPMWTTG